VRSVTAIRVSNQAHIPSRNTYAKICGNKQSPLGSSVHDWTNIQEGTCKPVYLAVFDRVGLQSNTAYLDVGCGSGVAMQLAFKRGAYVSGLDAAENLPAIARTRVPAGGFGAIFFIR